MENIYWKGKYIHVFKTNTLITFCRKRNKNKQVTFETGQTAFHLQDRETITKRSSLWASFLTSLAVHWSLRNVYIRRSHGEQIVARDGQLAEHGVVSTSQQSENNV